MKRNLLTKVTVALMATGICVSAANIESMPFGIVSELNASAIEIEEHGLGVPPIEELNVEEYTERFSDSTEQSSGKNLRLAEPGAASSCDLSEQINFPPIGDQGSLGSCTSMATTYYQFTYEAYKNSGINLKNDDNHDLIYSPAWPFNFTNGGNGGGAFIYKAYDVLKNHGALKLEDYPYDINNFNFSWSNNTEAMIEALNIRITEDGLINVAANNASNNLGSVKQILYGTDGTDGHVLTFSTQVSGWQYAQGTNLDTNSNEWVAYRCNDGGGGHSMTIVGYNDNIWCDINENGIQDNGELGAFKVANSWGTSYKNDGFVWVSYDALNATTAVSGDWESDETTTRIPIFQYERSGQNSLYWMEVGEEDVYYVGQLTIDTSYRNSLAISAGRNLSSAMNAYNFSKKLIPYGNASTELSHVGTLVFDYDDLAEPIGEYISGYNWFIRLNGNHNNASFKITDNLSNTIVDFGSISTGDSYMPISLSMGDLNYDGVVNSVDTEILYNARNNGTALSNLQEYLATNMDTPIQDYTVDYIVAADWGTGRNIQITITNTGDVAIRNWALQCSNFEGDISNPWNCTLLGDNIIKNAMYNSDIAVGQSVTFGYTLTNATGEIPVFSLCTFRSVKQNGYDVSLDVASEWDSGFIGNITITNTTNEPIMAWELSFTAVDFTITGGGQFEILENSGNNYTITGTYNGNIPIPANTSITMQFNGTKNGTPALSNVSMTEMVIEN